MLKMNRLLTIVDNEQIINKDEQVVNNGEQCQR